MRGFAVWVMAVSFLGAGCGDDETTGGADDLITLTLTYVSVPGTEDWDTIRIYREDQASPIYYLEQEIPRQALLPPLGADMTIESRLREADLLLNEQEPIGLFPLPDFTAAAVADRTLIMTGGGDHPGWAYYSPYAQYESWSPLNVWQLDDDDGNRGMAVYRLFGRFVILKQRSLWSARENAARLGEDPVAIQDSKGCIGPHANCLISDNRVAFLSPDRVVYVTDGLEVWDLSSRQIKETLRAFTDDQLSIAQMAHDSRSQKLWIKVGDTHLVFSYANNRWTTYELPSDSIGTAHKSTESAGDEIVWGFRGHSYRLKLADYSNQEGDYAGSETTFIASFTGSALETNGAGDVVALSGVTFQTDLEGLPCIVVAHTTVRDADPSLDSATFYEPMYEKARVYNHIAGIDGDNLFLGEPLDIGAETRVTIYIGTQYRKMRMNRYAPQGEGYPYVFSGISFLQGKDVEAGASSALRVRFDDDDPWLYSRGLAGGVRDRSFSTRKSGRSIQWMLEQTVRGFSLIVQKFICRSRVRGPRRKAY